MEKWDNYAIQAGYARQLFLNYDQEALIRKLNLPNDADYLYTKLFGEPYRIHRRTADISRKVGAEWVDANSFGESLTLLDLVCCCREERFLGPNWKNMTAFGLQFHQNLNEGRNPEAEYYEQHLESYRSACGAMGGKPFPQGDASYAFEVFDGLEVAVQLWLGDDEFPAQLRYLWNENANMYLKYETMYYALGLLRQRIAKYMKE